MISKIEKAASILRQGGLVAFPTETVYGLGADAKNPEGLKKIFIAKERPFDHPLIVHIGNIQQLSQWTIEVPADAKKLAEVFWPGSLTLIFKKAPTVLDLVTGGQETIGLRIPNHPVALALLEKFGGGIAAPSANRFGRISPTTAEAVREELDDRVDYVLDGGQCAVGVESTIVDVSSEEIRVLRPGMITSEEIEKVLGKSLQSSQKNIPRVSGSLESHYAPRTKTLLINRNELEIFLKNISENDLPMVCLVRKKILFPHKKIEMIVMPDHADQYAHDLYQTLRTLDKKNFRQIVIENVPEENKWDAVRDRLQKAASKISLPLR